MASPDKGWTQCVSISPKIITYFSLIFHFKNQIYKIAATLHGELKNHARALVCIMYDINAVGDDSLPTFEQKQRIQAKVKPLLVKGAWAHYVSSVPVCINLFPYIFDLFLFCFRALQKGFMAIQHLKHSLLTISLQRRIPWLLYF